MALIQKAARGEQFVQRRDHREHHAHGCLVGQLDHRQQLFGKQLRMRQRQPDAANTQIRVELGRCRQELQRLVTADIHCAQGNSPPVERFGDLAIHRELLLDIRCVLTAKEQELGANQAGEIGAMGRGGTCVIDRADVGPDGHRDTVAGLRGPAARSCACC